jgi:hypothetical protein
MFLSDRSVIYSAVVGYSVDPRRIAVTLEGI